MLKGAAAALCALLAACQPKSPLADLEAGERGRVVKVFDGDAFVLDTGQSVRLAGIEAPAAPTRKREGEDGHEKGKRLLEDMVLGREVQLYYGGLTRDRYDRALAQVETVDDLGPRLWLNAEMLKRGGARERVYADTARGTEDFADFERDARKAKTGLWEDGTFLIRAANTLTAETRAFELIDGTITDMTGTDKYGGVCHLGLKDAAVKLRIERGAAALCQTPEGTRILARGYVREGEMEITHSSNVEVLK
jgi:micrococcal nuclease